MKRKEIRSRAALACIAAVGLLAGVVFVCMAVGAAAMVFPTALVTVLLALILLGGLVLEYIFEDMQEKSLTVRRKEARGNKP